jgi:hypothetical protein
MIFLDGAWNSLFSTDPVIGDKKTSGNYSPIYQNLESLRVPGKPNLQLGPGWIEAASAFAGVPTCFVNGILVEITAHDVAKELMIAGVSSSLRSDIPCAAVTAMLGNEALKFPEHLMLSGKLPTRQAKPGLFASDITQLGSLLKSPSVYVKDESFLRSQQLLAQLDGQFQKRLEGPALETSRKWSDLRNQVLAQSLDQGIAIQVTPEIKSRYRITSAGTIPDLIAGSYLALKSDLTDFVAVDIGGFDTHTNELANQLPRQKAVARAVSQLLSDLATTPDPRAPNLNLIETTNVYIGSEFTRTIQLNGADGTDHRPTASAILCGRGVEDNGVIGMTTTKGNAMKWANGKPSTEARAPYLQPADLIATILRQFGRQDAAQKISEDTINGIFKGIYKG